MEVLTADLAYSVLRELMKSDVEEFWALALGPTKALLRSQMIFRGTVDACLVHPRDIFRFGCINNASSILVAHNHPSGDPTPSVQDLRFTRQLVRSAELIEIPVVDHLILTQTSYLSLQRSGWCRFEGLESKNLADSARA
jgi:DNA repair protein RadC